MTFSDYDAHTAPLFSRLNILDLNKLVIHRIALLMFKNSKDTLPKPVSELFKKNSDVHSHNTRNKASLYSQFGASEATHANFSFHGVHIWNILGNKIDNNVSYAGFKNLSKLYIQSHDIEYRLRT